MSDRIRIMNAKGKMYFFVLLLAIVSPGLSGPGCAAQDASAHPAWPGPGQLFVGACYQPIDRSAEQIDQDIAIMKRADFNVVRMGDRLPKELFYSVTKSLRHGIGDSSCCITGFPSK